METFSRYARTYLKDGVYAASDGVVAIFSLVAGVTGASLHSSVILILGFASVFANAFSMGTANFLGSQSEDEMYRRGKRMQGEKLRSHPEDSQQEIEAILSGKQYGGEQRGELARIIMHNKNFAADFLTQEEFGVALQEKGRAWRGGVITFITFTIAGIIPLLPYVVFLRGGADHLFFIAIGCTAIELFALGVFRSFLSDKSWLAAGIETFIFGGIAAAIAYTIGALLRDWVGNVPLGL